MPATISVIVPLHNNAATAAASLDSVRLSAEHMFMNLSSPPAVVVVAVDDGSRDGTGEILREYAARHPLTIVSRAEGSSPSRARNEGVDASSGDILCFLDGDDRFLEPHLLECAKVLRDPDVGFVKTGVRLSDPVHPDWKARIENSLVINLALRRRCHDEFGGFPEYHLHARRRGRIEPVLDIFRLIEDVYYNRMVASRHRGIGSSRETVEYLRHPGNSFDRQLAKFRLPPGEFPESVPPERALQVDLAASIYKYILSQS